MGVENNYKSLLKGILTEFNDNSMVLSLVRDPKHIEFIKNDIELIKVILCDNNSGFGTLGQLLLDELLREGKSAKLKFVILNTVNEEWFFKIVKNAPYVKNNINEDEWAQIFHNIGCSVIKEVPNLLMESDNFFKKCALSPKFSLSLMPAKNGLLDGSVIKTVLQNNPIDYIALSDNRKGEKELVLAVLYSPKMEFKNHSMAKLIFEALPHAFKQDESIHKIFLEKGFLNFDCDETLKVNLSPYFNSSFIDDRLKRNLLLSINKNLFIFNDNVRSVLNWLGNEIKRPVVQSEISNTLTRYYSTMDRAKKVNKALRSVLLGDVVEPDVRACLMTSKKTKFDPEGVLSQIGIVVKFLENYDLMEKIEVQPQKIQGRIKKNKI